MYMKKLLTQRCKCKLQLHHLTKGWPIRSQSYTPVGTAPQSVTLGVISYNTSNLPWKLCVIVIAITNVYVTLLT